MMKTKPEEPKIHWTMNLTEPRRKFIVEASKRMLASHRKYYDDYDVRKIACEILSWLPEVMYGTGKIGDKPPFDKEPTHRIPTMSWMEVVSMVASFDATTEYLYWEMRHEECEDLEYGQLVPDDYDW